MPNLTDFVYDDSGDAISGATVDVFARNTTTPSVDDTTTDSNGKFDFAGLAEGRYDVRITNGSDVRWRKYDIRWQVEEIEAAVLKVRNPADTFVYNLVPAAISANRTLNLPLITQTETLATISDISGTSRYIQMTVVDFEIAITTGNGKYYLHIPPDFNGMNLTYVHAKVITAGTTGLLTIQIHNVTDAVDMLSTELTVDSGETGSDTAATPAVIDTSNDDLDTNDLLRVDIDGIPSTAPKGLIVTLGFQTP